MSDENKEAYLPTLAQDVVGADNLARMRRSWASHIWHLLDKLEPMIPDIDKTTEDEIAAAKTYCLRGLASPPEAYADEVVE